MSRDRLLSDNEDLKHQIQALQTMLGRSRVAGELTPFRGWLEGQCHRMRSEAIGMLTRIRALDDEVYPEVALNLRDDTRTRRDYFESINSQYAAVVTRATVEDRLPLLVLRFLHESHDKTRAMAFGVTDGSIAVQPTLEQPPIYYLPVSRQRTILYLPLLGHEFGHTLYALHDEVLAGLISEFERHVVDSLILPETQVTDELVDFVERLTRSWVNWMQELFCDAVGLALGGPSFLYAYDHYFRLRWREELMANEEELVDATHTHPNIVLRTRLLLKRADRIDAPESKQAVAEVRAAWDADIAESGMPNFYRTWSDAWEPKLQLTLDQMLAVVKLRSPRPDDYPLNNDAALANPIALANAAWAEHNSRPKTYRGWERRAIRRFLQAR